jgi:hypothetical protein
MFENIALGAVQMLVLLFWITLAFIMIYGALWVRAQKKAKHQFNF